MTKVIWLVIVCGFFLFGYMYLEKNMVEVCKHGLKPREPITTVASVTTMVHITTPGWRVICDGIWRPLPVGHKVSSVTTGTHFPVYNEKGKMTCDENGKSVK